MTKFKSFLGYSVAVLCIPIMIAAVLGPRIPVVGPSVILGFLSATGLKHSANWTGGEVVRTIEHGAYQTDVHRAVFDALIREHREGFIQVAWRPVVALPAHIEEEIDVDGDGQADFQVALEKETKQATLTPYAPNVLELEGIYDLNGKLAVRVRLGNPAR